MTSVTAPGEGVVYTITRDQYGPTVLTVGGVDPYYLYAKRKNDRWEVVLETDGTDGRATIVGAYEYPSHAAARILYENGTPPTRAQAQELQLPGWNIRCNRCGGYGAEWLPNQRPGWGALAQCPPHAREIEREMLRHAAAMRDMRVIKHEQDGGVLERAVQMARSVRPKPPGPERAPTPPPGRHNA